MFENEIRRLSEAFLIQRVWNEFVVGKVRGAIVPCRFCGEVDDDDHPVWDYTYPSSPLPLVQLLENPEFT